MVVLKFIKKMNKVIYNSKLAHEILWANYSILK